MAGTWIPKKKHICPECGWSGMRGRLRPCPKCGCNNVKPKEQVACDYKKLN